MYFSKGQARSALLFAAFNGCKDIVEILLNYNININVVDELGYSALHIA